MPSTPVLSRSGAAILALMGLVFISCLALAAHAIFHLAEIAGRRYRKRAEMTQSEDKSVDLTAKQREA